MLTLHNLTKRYGDDLVLDRVSFTVNAGERVGLVGPNGAGKSTLLRIIAGAEPADGGSVTRTPADLVHGYLSQGWDGPPGMTVSDALHEARPGADARTRLADLEQRMAVPGLSNLALQTLLAEYAAAQEQFQALGGYEWAQRAEAVRTRLGLAGLPPDMPITRLSGGQQTRLGLTRLLLARPRLLLIDEPTNHLDEDAVAWLEEFLAGYDRTALLVSHDRVFLDRTAARILELKRYDSQQPQPQIRSYVGAYSNYVDARQSERMRQAAQWQDQQAYVANVTADVQRLKRYAQVAPHTAGSKKMARMAKARERKLDRYAQSDQRVTKRRQSWGVKLDFGAAADGARVVLRVEAATFSYDILPDDERRKTRDEGLRPSSPLLDNITFELTHGERVALVGPNGAGKSTLLKLIGGQLKPDAGQVWRGANVQLGYLAQEQEMLDQRGAILDALRAAVPWSMTECRGFLHRYLFAGDEVFRPVAACSFGERARLALALLVARGCTFLVLDEPINHLDIPARERFEQALEAFDGTILAVTHDRYFLDRFAERVLALRGGHLLDYPGSYADFVAADKRLRAQKCVSIA